MVYAVPAGVAIAASAWLTSWVSARFDSATPPAWTQRRHARELVSAGILTIWMASCLLAGQAFLLLERGTESPELFALGAGIAATGGFPALLGVARPKRQPPAKPRR